MLQKLTRYHKYTFEEINSNTSKIIENDMDQMVLYFMHIEYKISYFGNNRLYENFINRINQGNTF